MVPAASAAADAPMNSRRLRYSRSGVISDEGISGFLMSIGTHLTAGTRPGARPMDPPEMPLCTGRFPETAGSVPGAAMDTGRERRMDFSGVRVTDDAARG